MMRQPTDLAATVWCLSKPRLLATPARPLSVWRIEDENGRGPLVALRLGKSEALEGDLLYGCERLEHFPWHLSLGHIRFLQKLEAFGQVFNVNRYETPELWRAPLEVVFRRSASRIVERISLVDLLAATYFHSTDIRVQRKFLGVANFYSLSRSKVLTELEHRYQPENISITDLDLSERHVEPGGIATARAAPIIFLEVDGVRILVDGVHRVLKARAEGRDTLPAVVLDAQGERLFRHPDRGSVLGKIIDRNRGAGGTHSSISLAFLVRAGAQPPAQARIAGAIGLSLPLTPATFQTLAAIGYEFDAHARLLQTAACARLFAAQTAAWQWAFSRLLERYPRPWLAWETMTHFHAKRHLGELGLEPGERKSLLNYTYRGQTYETFERELLRPKGLRKPRHEPPAEELKQAERRYWGELGGLWFRHFSDRQNWYPVFWAVKDLQLSDIHNNGEEMIQAYVSELKAAAARPEAPRRPTRATRGR